MRVLTYNYILLFVNKKIEKMMQSLDIDVIPSITENEKDLVVLIIIFWDDIIGPKLKDYFPKDKEFSFSIRDIGEQLFQSAVSIYGSEEITKAEGILLNIENIERSGYIFFDSYPDNTTRAGERQYLIAIIAPKINYFESLKIKEIFKEISVHIKEKKDWSIKNYREKILNILSIAPL